MDRPDTMGPTTPAEAVRIMGAAAGRMWWIFLVAGIGWLLVAVIVLRMDLASIAAVGVLIGILFLGASLNEFAFARVMQGGWRILHNVMGAVFLLGGLWGFIRPVNTFFALASVLGLILVLQGSFEIARAIAIKDENELWWLSLITGILLLLLAFWVSGSDRVFVLAQRTYLILFWAGFMALFRGVTQIGLAFALRRAGRGPERA